jgi:hypothetical protein
MLRYSLLFGGAVLIAAGASHAQTRGQNRDDLLDALTRHIQICAELGDTQARLSCYDKLQTQVGGVQPGPTATPTPTPLRPMPQAAAPQPQPQPQPQLEPLPQASAPGNPVPLASPPLMTPGGAPATLGGPQPPLTQDPDRAFDPRSATYRPPESIEPKPQPMVRRTGPRPIPNYGTQQSLVSLGASNLTYGDSRYWQVTITVTSNTPRTLETQVQCTFQNAGRPVAEGYFGPVSIASGEQITAEVIGPPTSAYIDSSNCRVLRP